MVKKPKERIMVHKSKEIGDTLRVGRQTDYVEPVGQFEQARKLKQEQNFYYNMKNRVGKWSCRVEVPLLSVTQIKRASRVVRALANELNQIATYKEVYPDHKIQMAQIACNRASHTLTTEAGTDRKPLGHRGLDES